MKFLLDIDTCVFWLRGQVSVRNHLAAVAPEEVALSVITLAELRYGAACSARPESNHQAIDDFISALSVLEVASEIAHVFGDQDHFSRIPGLRLENWVQPSGSA